jgi:glutathione S-transferase
MERKIELGYWQIKLKGHHIRWLLHYLKSELGGHTEWFPKTPEEWKSKKEELSHLNPLATLPYIRSADTVVTRPQAILMAICMKANRNDLLGRNMDEAIEVRAV